MLDLDHVGAENRELIGRERPRQHVGDVDDADALERTGHGGAPRILVAIVASHYGESKASHHPLWPGSTRPSTSPFSRAAAHKTWTTGSSPREGKGKTVDSDLLEDSPVGGGMSEGRGPFVRDRE